LKIERGRLRPRTSASSNWKISVDTDSEVHHFVVSAINVYKKKARKRSKHLANIVKERRESGKAAKNTHVQNICMMEEATRLLAELGVLRKDLPERHDKSYDSTILDALNKGGFLYVSPQYLAWAKILMTKVRA
jgi:hypothetical protein